jgi:hypothetical protein
MMRRTTYPSPFMLYTSICPIVMESRAVLEELAVHLEDVTHTFSARLAPALHGSR